MYKSLPYHYPNIGNFLGQTDKRPLTVTMDTWKNGIFLWLHSASRKTMIKWTKVIFSCLNVIIRECIWIWVTLVWLNFYILTQDVRTGDKAVHRDKEMRKIEKCSRSLRWTIWVTFQIVGLFLLTCLWTKNEKNLFFHFQIFLTLADILS